MTSAVGEGGGKELHVSGRPINPSDVRDRVIRELAALPPELHLDALHAIDHGRVEVDLSDPDVVRVVLDDRLTIDVPVEEWHDPADASPP